MNTSRQIEPLAWRCLVLGFDGPNMTDEARRMIGQGAGGVILFHRNIEDARQVRDLTDSIRAAAPGPVIMSVDQEGGRVARLRGIATDLPPMREVGRFGPETVERIGRLMATELSSLGLDLVFAPVADVDTNPDNPVIGARSFSSDAATVASLTCAFVRGLQGAGLAGCGKHFPGHGDTGTDSHLDMPRIEHERARLDAVELVPFAALSRAGVATMMTAHVLVEKVDRARPATMSKDVLSILRDELRFAGPVLTDDMEMLAIADNYELGDAAVQAVAAGCDQVLVCHRADRQARVVEALVEAAMDGRLTMERLSEAASRTEALTRNYSPSRERPVPCEVLRTEESLAFAEGLFETTVVVQGEDPTGSR